MITGRDFIITGLQPWDIPIGSNAKDIALEISKNNRVLYINTPLTKKIFQRGENTPDTIQRRNVVKKQCPILRQVYRNLWVLDYPFTIWPVNSLPDGVSFDLLNRINNYKMYSFVKIILTQLQFENFILFIDNDIYRSFYAKEFLKPSHSIYYRRDNLNPVSFWKKHSLRLEPLLIKKSDLVVCNSEQLAQYARIFNKHTYDVGQGVNLSSYTVTATFNTPIDIREIKCPIIGYCGDINSHRLDITLIYKLALNNPDMSFVLVGKYDTVFSSHQLKTLSNVYFLGLKPKEQIPEYIQSFDICLNPQLVNDITIGNYPRKIDEFLALGKPVIATSTQMMQLFKDYVYLCNTIEDYQQSIEAALSLKDEQIIQQRILFAHTHTWSNSVAKIYQYINTL